MGGVNAHVASYLAAITSVIEQLIKVILMSKQEIDTSAICWIFWAKKQNMKEVEADESAHAQQSNIDFATIYWETLFFLQQIVGLTE